MFILLFYFATALFPKNKRMRKIARKTKNRILAMPSDVPEILVNPKIPASKAKSKKKNAHFNMLE